MALTAGTISSTAVYSTEAALLSAAATMGTSPYTYQWYRSTMAGFSPGGGNILAGKTALSFTDTGLSPSTTYYYKVVATDSAGSPATATSNQLEVDTNMSLTAGALSLVSNSTGQSVQALSAVATMGTSPYTYQWYRSTVTGFSPGGGNILSGKTTLALTDSTVVPGTAYFYKVVVTDSAGSPATATSSQLEVDTPQVQPSQNQFAQLPYLGTLDQRFNYNTVPCMVDDSQSGSILAGQPVKIVDSADGSPKVVAIAAITDEVFGYVNFNVKNRHYSAGDAVEISQAGNVIWLNATAAIARGAQVCVSFVSVGAVTPSTSTANIVGYAFDKAVSPGDLIRVKLSCPSFAFAS